MGYNYCNIGLVILNNYKSGFNSNLIYYFWVNKVIKYVHIARHSYVHT